MGMFVLDLEGQEMDVVQVSVDPNHLDDDIGQYRHHHDDDNTDTEGERQRTDASD